MAGFRGRIEHVFCAGRRRNIADNLRAAFREKTEGEIAGICRKIFVATERGRVEQRRLERLSDPGLRRIFDRMELRGQAHLEAAGREGRPVILVTPHYGSFMLGALRVAADYARHGVYFFYNPPERNAYAETSNRLLDRPASNCHKIYNNLHGVKTALKVLKGQGTLCMMPDLISVTTSGVYVPFCGRFFTAMAGIAFLALRSDAAVIPAYCYPDGGSGHLLEFRPPLDLAPAGEKTDEDRVYELTARLFRELERQITLRPEHWRYWHIYLKRSIPFPTPPASPGDLLAQLEGCDAMVAQDELLAEAIRQWREGLREKYAAI